jgi:hypothetical protein
MPSRSPATTTTPADSSDPLDRLDEVLGRIRRVLQRPGYRRRLLEGLSTPVELALLRLLRVVERAGDAPTIGFVADRLAIDPSTASRVVERAVAAGLLERHVGRVVVSNPQKTRAIAEPKVKMLYAGLDLSRKRLDFHLLDEQGVDGPFRDSLPVLVSQFFEQLIILHQEWAARSCALVPS